MCYVAGDVGILLVTTFLCETLTGHCGGFRSTTENRNARVDVVGEGQITISLSESRILADYADFWGTLLTHQVAVAYAQGVADKTVCLEIYNIKEKRA